MTTREGLPTKDSHCIAHHTRSSSDRRTLSLMSLRELVAAHMAAIMRNSVSVNENQHENENEEEEVKEEVEEGEEEDVIGDYGLHDDDDDDDDEYDGIHDDEEEEEEEEDDFYRFHRRLAAGLDQYHDGDSLPLYHGEDFIDYGEEEEEEDEEEDANCDCQYCRAAAVAASRSRRSNVHATDSLLQQQKEQQEHHHWNISFMDTCLGLARNDDTIVDLSDNWTNGMMVRQTLNKMGPGCRDGLGHTMIVSKRPWTLSDLIWFGKSLQGNTKLKQLTMAMNAYCPFCPTPPKPTPTSFPWSVHTLQDSVNATNALAAQDAVMAICQGLYKSQLHHFFLANACACVQTACFQGVYRSMTIQQLEVWDSIIVRIPYVTQLLYPAPPMVSTSSSSASQFFRPSGIPALPLTPSLRQCHLTHLMLRNCRIDNIDMLALSLALTDNPWLVSLNLENNGICSSGIWYFLTHWKESSPLQELDFGWNMMGADAALALVLHSIQHPALRKLVLSGNNQIGHDGLERIGYALPLLTTLQVLHLHRCSNEPYSPRHNFARIMATGLRGNSSLRDFDVGANNIGARGAKWIMQTVVEHPTLEALSLAYDISIGFKGLTCIGKELARAPRTFHRLNLDGIIFPWPESESKVCKRAGQALQDGMQQNPYLTSFSFFGLGIPYLVAILDLIEMNATCRPLLTTSMSHVITPAVWPHILAQFCRRKNKHSHIFFLLKEQPWLIIGRRPHAGASVLKKKTTTTTRRRRRRY